MPQQTHNKRERHEAIAELLDGQNVSSQRELAALLAEREIEVNQATLSRDIRQLGVVKGPDGYRLPDDGTFRAEGPAALTRAAREFLVSVAQAANQVVLRTPPSAAQPLALAVDRAGLDGVLGTVAGDDTVLVIASSSRAASSLARELERIAGGGRA